MVASMATASKTLLRTGIYEAPQGTLRATTSRIRGWVDKFRSMRERGIRVPVSWGHQPDAVPGDANDRARKQYWLGAYNAGYLDDLTLTPSGALDGKLDCPGVELDGDKLVHWVRLPDGRQVKSAIAEVSLAIKDHTDGEGRKWPDSIVHVALTPLPVAHGTGGFSLGTCTGQGDGFTLSLSQLTQTLSAIGDDAVDEPNDDKPEGGMPEGGKGKAKADYFSDCLAILKARGLALPPDTNVKNVWERLYVAGHALDGAEAATGEDMGGDDLPPMDDEPEVTFDDAAAEGGEADEMGGDPLDVGATPEGEDEDAPVEEEQRPVMMSLAKLKDPVARGSVRVLEKKHKASLLARIERLQKRGLSPAMAQELRDSLDGYSLGFTLSADGEVQIGNKQLDRRISDVERVMPLRNPLKGMRTAKAQSRPMRTEAETTRAQEDAGDELARLAGVNVPMATKKNRA